MRPVLLHLWGSALHPAQGLAWEKSLCQLRVPTGDVPSLLTEATEAAAEPLHCCWACWAPGTHKSTFSSIPPAFCKAWLSPPPPSGPRAEPPVHSALNVPLHLLNLDQHVCFTNSCFLYYLLYKKIPQHTHAKEKMCVKLCIQVFPHLTWKSFHWETSARRISVQISKTLG